MRDTEHRTDVMIIGGGIGGLAAALCLHDAGLNAEVFEAVSAIRPLGVGINVLPHSVKELDRLGLLAELDRIAVRTSSLSYYSRHGQLIWREARGTDAGYQWPQFSIHRGRLQSVLLNKAIEQLGSQRIHCDRRLVAFADDGKAVKVQFAVTDGPAGIAAASSAIMIGADGIHSTVRQSFNPNEGDPIWDGRILWRGVAQAAPFLDGRSMIMAGHERQKFVCYPINPGLDDNGLQEINWIAELKFDANNAFHREDWNRTGRHEDFLPQFESWAFDWLDIPALIRSTDAIFEYPMVDRDPLEQWAGGRTTLLGDAAHPMYPIGSNGSSQAVLDARTLADAIRTCGLTPDALRTYEQARRPPTSAIVLANRQNGPEQVMQIVEDRAPNGFGHIDDVISPHDLMAIANRYKQTAGFDIATVNSAENPQQTPSNGD